MANFEVGKVKNLTHAFQTIPLSSEFNDPVVVAGPASFNEQDAGVVIIDNVTSTSFDIRFREWDYLDGSHNGETASYLVVERGTSTLPSGSLVQAGTVDLGSNWGKNDFATSFPALPVILTTVASSEFAGTVAPRIRSLSKVRFYSRYWLEEKNRTNHGIEKLNWVAIAPGSDDGTSGNQPWETLNINTDERFKLGSFKGSYLEPCVLADINTPTSNPVTVRLRNLANDSVEAVAHEEQSRDSETVLGNEKVSLFIAECAPTDTLNAREEDNTETASTLDKESPDWTGTELTATAITESALTISWSPGATDDTGVSQYEVFLDDVSVGTTNEYSMNLNALTPMTTYQLKITASDAAGNSSSLTGSAKTGAEPSAENHSIETGLALAVTDQFTTIDFGSYFIDPVVVAGPASSIDQEPGVVVIDNITNTSFDIRFREWNYQDGYHGPEKVAYMVAERGVTTLPSGAVIRADTAMIGTGWSTIKYGGAFDANPIVLNTIASANDIGTIAPRISSLGKTSFRSRYWLEEANSKTHAAESLNWIAIETGRHDGSADGFSWETIQYNTDEVFRATSFSNTYTNPCVLGEINSLTPNPSTLRYKNLSGSSVEVHLQEETSKDSETFLGLETAALFVNECTSIDSAPPIWTDGGSLEIVNATPFSVDLIYAGAVDNIGLDYFEVFQDGFSIGTSQTQLFSVADLSPSTTYNFQVVAIDVLGNQSTSGPETNHTTDSAPMSKISGVLWLDSNANSIRDTDEPGIPSATVTLALDDGDFPGVIDASNTIIDIRTNESNGSYTFNYLPANNYLVSPTAFVGYNAENPIGPVSVKLGPYEERGAIDFAFSVDANALLGTPFGTFVQISRIESLLPQFNAAHFLLGSPAEATYYLNLARLTNTRMIINLSLDHRNADRTFNLDMWQAALNKFAEFDFSPWVNDGTIIAHYLIDEPKSRGSWGGQIVHNQTLDDMAEYSKKLWPYLPTTVRMQPTKLALHGSALNRPIPGWKWEHLDSAWAQYNSRQVANVNTYIDAERQSAIDQNLGLVFGIQAMVGGNGSSGVHPQPPFNTQRWTMSATEIMNYSTAMLETEFACAFLVFRYDRFDETHFERPEIAQAMTDLTQIAENFQPGFCGIRN